MILPPAESVLEVRRLRKFFPVQSGFLNRITGHVQAVNDVSFNIERGEVVGLVGESGSGKSTVARMLLRLIEPSGGEIRFSGVDIRTLSRAAIRANRREMQFVFQDPFASLDPRMTVSEIIGEAFEIHGLHKGGARTKAIADSLREVGLLPEHMSRRPYEFSGGQRQRIGIARALAVRPSFIVADEPVSALDVSVQAQILNLIQDLQRDFGLTVLFIAHDLLVVEYLCDRIIVMYLGRVMEIASSSELYLNPKHPYTEALLAAAPVPDPTARKKAAPLKGDIPSPINPPSGCVFRTRCPYAMRECSEIVPALREVGPGHFKACIRDVL